MADYQPIQDEPDGNLDNETRLFAKQSDDSLEWVLPSSFEGEDGTDGVGVPAGGTTGQQLVKTDEVDYNTEWADPPDADDIDDAATTNKFATAAQLSAIATNTSDIGDLETALDAQSLPTGGTADQILVKTDGTNYNAEWSDFDADSIDDSASTNKFATAEQLAQIATNTSNLDDLSDDLGEQVPPAGGSDGQVLTKASATDYDYAWETPSGGDVDSVNGETGTVVLDPDDLDDTSTTNKFATAAQLAAADQAAQVTAYDPTTGQLAIAGYEVGDTGWLDVEADLINDWTAIQFWIRRVGNVVHVAAQKLNGGTDDGVWNHNAPEYTGFQPGGPGGAAGRVMVMSVASTVYRTFHTSNVWSINGGASQASSFYFATSWVTDDAWPVSLPGIVL